MEAKKKTQQEFILLLVILAYFTFLFINAFPYPRDARLFPIVLSAPGILITAALIFKCARKIRTEEPAAAQTGGGTTAPMWQKVLPFLFGVLYYAAVQLAGFIIATVLASLCVPYLMGYRNKLRIVLFTLGLMAMIYAVFGLLLSMPFYKGLLGLI